MSILSFCSTVKFDSYKNKLPHITIVDKRVCSWLRHWATHRKVAGLITGVFIEIFPWHKRVCRKMDRGSSHTLNTNSSRNISWG